MSNALRACCLLFTGVLCAIAAADFPPVPPLADKANFGVGIQRTMTLLATSTPQHRKRVRVLFYGQSITNQAWTGLVGDDLKKRFPNADIELVNKSIGGFASQLLSKITEHDVFIYQPDLVIFHVYGANDTYEQIIKSIRTRTSAEMLLQKDHIGAELPPVVNNWDEANALQAKNHNMWWDHMMNQVFVPDIAKKYGCGVADVRSAWRQYLTDNKLETKALLADDIHLNDHGCFVMAGIISQYLVHRPDLPAIPEASALTRDVAPEVAGKQLTVSAEGNGFELLIGEVAKPITATVTIDGKKPSEFPGCYLFTRPSPPPPVSPISLIRVDSNAQLVVEDWTLTITSVADDGTSWGYSLKGSVTGADGDGNSGADFTSTSGRVVIKSDSWFKGWTDQKLQVGSTVEWTVQPMFADTVELKAGPAGKETFQTLALGLPNEKHTVVLTASADLGKAVKAVRVHRPAVK
jgi:hypothetical protein